MQHIQREALKYEEGRKISSKHRSEKNEETKWRNKMAVQPGTKPDRVHKLKEIRQPPNRGLAKGQPRELREVSKGFKPMPSNK